MKKPIYAAMTLLLLLPAAPKRDFTIVYRIPPPSQPRFEKPETPPPSRIYRLPLPPPPEYDAPVAEHAVTRTGRRKE